MLLTKNSYDALGLHDRLLIRLNEKLIIGCQPQAKDMGHFIGSLVTIEGAFLTKDFL